MTKMQLRQRPRLHTEVLGGQRRSFMGLQRTPPPKPAMMGYLVAQGFIIVLLADLGIATVTGKVTTVRSVCQAAGFWKGPVEFEEAHGVKR
ncbi:hypothetical protein Tdes44962_MAKER06923 [Teratosphaeria destructans]|uniref:Uncharacterized protein n=1 Tax=Teratosphaeria destructans TaxID=418781 RepID=A0A9W7T127_9PEZI|nr:hypothetical protein Tdes44962_MAKER06923 [Teratosphaeria destructans]